MQAHLPLAFDTPLFRLGGATITLTTLLAVAAVLVGCAIAVAVVEMGARRMARREAGNASALYAGSRIARYAIWIAGSFLAISVAGIDLGGLAFLAGALGVGIGFGLQNVVNNFVCGIVILLEGTLRIGDFVDLQSGVRGHVRAIGLRYTQVTTNDAIDVIVPNSEFVNGRVTNWTLGSSNRRVRVPFSVAYGADKEAVRSAAIGAAGRVAGTLGDEAHAPGVWLVNLGDNGMEFELVVWVGADRVARPSNTHAAYLWEIESALRAAGIEVPFPQRDLRVRGPVEVRIDGPEQTRERAHTP
jgi:small-conductance mechanosensitive channel